MKITIDLPDTALPAEKDPQFYKEALVAALYNAGKVSSKEACEILNLSRREFEELLPRFGSSIMPDDDETIAAELNA